MRTRAHVLRFSANQMEKVKPRCIQCVASDLHLKKSRSRNKRKRSKNERDTTLRRDSDPFLAIGTRRRRGDYALEDDHTLPGANISEGRIRVESRTCAIRQCIAATNQERTSSCRICANLEKT